MKTLSATPRPYDRWKAENLSFLHVLLVWGVTLTTIKVVFNGMLMFLDATAKLRWVEIG